MSISQWRSKDFYWGCAIVFAAGIVLFVLFHFLSVSAFVVDLAAVPSVVALFGALFQLARDNLAHERTLRLEAAKNSFTVGATSHMASVAFDKHVEFCEEYVAATFEGLATLFTKGPTPDALKHAEQLLGIRRKNALWLTPELESELERFEAALRDVGADAWLVREAPDMQNRADVVRKMYATFAKVVGLSRWEGEEITDDLALATIVNKLRRVLGIDELTHLRSELIQRAMENLQDLAGGQQ
jgi:hypothetical protein